MKLNKKLIEVALPLDAINAASVREKSIRHGHPSTLHLWWARRPLASARAVIFSQTVDDPSEYVDELLADPKARANAQSRLTKAKAEWQPRNEAYEKAQNAGMSENQAPYPGPEPTIQGMLIEIERQRLFKIIEDLVLWENTTNQKVIAAAQAEIKKSWQRTCRQNADHPQAAELFNPDRLPGFHDPFAGGGTLPLEALRLGFESYASDLNPIPILINKALIELPQPFADQAPLHPPVGSLPNQKWQGFEGLIADLEYYGNWIRAEAENRIGELYPKVTITAQMAQDRPDLAAHVGKTYTVVAYLWARTVASKSPMFKHVQVPLVSTFILSKRKNNEHYVQIKTEGDRYWFEVKKGVPADEDTAGMGTKLGRGSNFACALSGSLLDGDYIKQEGTAKRIGTRMMAIVLDGPKGKLFISPTDEQEAIAQTKFTGDRPENELVGKAGDQLPLYGYTRFGDLFTDRQLSAITTFVELVQEARKKVEADAAAKGWNESNTYAKALGVYLAFSVSRAIDHWSSSTTWNNIREIIRNVFSRQAIAMNWDFIEVNPLTIAGGGFLSKVNAIIFVMRTIPTYSSSNSITADAALQKISINKIVATDPPYYDNIQYADLSDFFYVWLRPMLRESFPELFGTLAVPKSEELVANKSRHGGAKQAEEFFLEGMSQAIHQFGSQAHAAFPIAIYYAFKQSETKAGQGTVSTGWETFLAAIKNADLTVSGTWPMRTELITGLKKDANALASSVVLVCRRRSDSAESVSRREFLAHLKRELPAALRELQATNTAPVDLAQAAIGPGMAVFTRYKDVLEADGTPLTMRQALALINQILDETLAEQEGDFDADTRWALTWFEQHGFNPSEYGDAETLAKAKNTSITGLVDAGILKAASGKAQLLRPEQYDAEWDPASDKRIPVWQMTQQLARANQFGGQAAGAALLTQLGAKAEAARELCYRLYTTCERKGWASDAGLYNMLVQNWRDMSQQASQMQTTRQTEQQGRLI